MGWRVWRVSSPAVSKLAWSPGCCWVFRGVFWVRQDFEFFLSLFIFETHGLPQIWGRLASFPSLLVLNNNIRLTPDVLNFLYQRCHCMCELDVFQSMPLFSEPRRFRSPFLFSTYCPEVIEEDTQRAVVARNSLGIRLFVMLAKYHTGLQLILPQVCEMSFVIHHEDHKR